MSDLVEKVAREIARERWTAEAADPHLIDAEVEYGWDMYKAEARAAIAAVAEFLCLEAARSASPAQAHEYLSATLLKKQLETPK